MLELVDKSRKYKRPTDETLAILNRALHHIRSVPYKVDARFVFYRMKDESEKLLQNQWPQKPGEDHSDHKDRMRSNFSGILSRARHTPMGVHPDLDPWTPELLEDESRPHLDGRLGGHSDMADWLDGLGVHVSCWIDKPDLDPWAEQPNYVFVTVEAIGMMGQFRHHASGYGVPVWPFKGDCSIPVKGALANEMNWVADTYPDADLVVIHFGDEDGKGNEIPLDNLAHVQTWTEAKFTAYRGGLLPRHLEELDWDGSTMEWQSLPDAQAGMVIRDALDRFIDKDRYRKAVEEANEKHDELDDKMRERLDLAPVRKAAEDLLEELTQ